MLSIQSDFKMMQIEISHCIRLYVFDFLYVVHAEIRINKLMRIEWHETAKKTHKK